MEFLGETNQLRFTASLLSETMLAICQDTMFIKVLHHIFHVQYIPCASWILNYNL